MNDIDDKFLIQLSQEWQKTENKKPDISVLKRRLLKHRFQMIGLTFTDLVITAVALFLFYKGYKNYYPVIIMIWIGFGIIFGLVTTIIGTVQRLRVWRNTDLDTKSWLVYEYKHSKSQLAYSKLMKYGVLTFGLFFHIWLFLGFFFDGNFPLGINFETLLIYLFSITWFSIFLWVARRIRSKALIAIDYLNRENREFNDL